MLKWLAIGIGGGIGSMARYGMGNLVQNYIVKTTHFPIGTAFVNLSGCLIIGLVAGWIDAKHSINDGWGLFLMVGMLGGYTTFATFGLENWHLLKNAKVFLFMSNIILQVAGGIVLGWIGFYFGEKLGLQFRY